MHSLWTTLAILAVLTLAGCARVLAGPGGADSVAAIVLEGRGAGRGSR